ncbi:MAG: hypothetical protein J2P24_00290 [Streptosporangiales bacterium]|nr:hypothetical protein [Streptosporangiales bacterium]
MVLSGVVVDARAAQAAVDPVVIGQLETLFAVAFPALLGWGVSWLTAFVVREHLPSWAKIVVNGVLTVIAAAVTTVPFMSSGDVPGDLKAYLVALVAAGAANAITYIKGGPKVAERATWNKGLIGRKVDESELGFMGKHAADDQSGQPA